MCDKLLEQGSAHTYEMSTMPPFAYANGRNKVAAKVYTLDDKSGEEQRSPLALTLLVKSVMPFIFISDGHYIRNGENQGGKTLAAAFPWKRREPPAHATCDFMAREYLLSVFSGAARVSVLRSHAAATATLCLPLKS